MSEGLQLLAQAFPELLDSGGGYAGERSPEQDFRESTKGIGKVPQFGIEDFPAETDGDIRVKASRSPDRGGDMPIKQVHALAWYQPYRFYGKRKWDLLPVESHD